MTKAFVAGGEADACTLPSAQRPLRLAEFTDLFRSSLVATDRRGPRRARLVLHGRPDLADTVRDLTARESQCCSFFSFDIRDQGAEVLLDVEVPDAYADVDVLSGLVDLARSVSGLDGA